MKSLFSFFVLILSAGLLLAQGFEGTIEFKKVKKGRESTYIYYVKGDQVRLEEFGPNKTIVDLAIIDLAQEKVYLVSPERKSYMELMTAQSTKDMSQTSVLMTKDTKTLMGYPCSKWIVSNKDLNAVVTYWVTKGNYDFFVKLLSTLRRKDYHALFYQQVPAAIGYFPMSSVWTDVNGTELERLEVVKIDPHVLRGNFFTIPADYEEMKN